MSQELEQAERYRQKAEELRTLAAATKDPSSREVRLKIAENYDQLARNMETLHRVSVDLDASATPRGARRPGG